MELGVGLAVGTATQKSVQQYAWVHDYYCGVPVYGDEKFAEAILLKMVVLSMQPTDLEDDRVITYLRLDGIDAEALLSYDYNEDVVEVLGRKRIRKGVYEPVKYRFDVDGECKTVHLGNGWPWNFSNEFLAKLPAIGKAGTLAERLRDTRNFERDMAFARRKRHQAYVVEGRSHDVEIVYTKWEADALVADWSTHGDEAHWQHVHVARLPDFGFMGVNPPEPEDEEE